MNLASVDLNLLVAFDALMTHRHVTRAGEAVGLSQPAMSNALSRLRGLFDDQLLVRSGSGMDPTPRARQLQDPIRRALQQIETSLGDEDPFAPETAVQIIRLAITEDEAFLLLPRLQSYLAKHAPGISLDVRSTANIPAVRLLADDECDVAIGRIPAAAPAAIRREDLLTQKFACMARRGHPAFDGPLTLEDYIAYPHIQVKPSGRPTSMVDEGLARLGLQRQIAISVSLFMVAPFLIAETDLIANFPERLAAAVAPNLDVVVRELPIDLDAMVTAIGWHQRNDENAAHRWMRGIIREIGQAA